MTDLVTAIQTAITPASIYGVFETIMPFVGSMVLVVLGITVLRRLVKGASKLRLRF